MLVNAMKTEVTAETWQESLVSPGSAPSQEPQGQLKLLLYSISFLRPFVTTNSYSGIQFTVLRYF